VEEEEVEGEVMRFQVCWYDIWIGVYIAPQRIYVCPLPCLVFSWLRRANLLEMQAKKGE
jgi:hypothetical protein